MSCVLTPLQVLSKSSSSYPTQVRRFMMKTEAQRGGLLYDNCDIQYLLLLQNSWDLVVYKAELFIFYNSRRWEYRIQEPISLVGLWITWFHDRIQNVLRAYMRKKQNKGKTHLHIRHVFSSQLTYSHGSSSNLLMRTEPCVLNNLWKALPSKLLYCTLRSQQVPNTQALKAHTNASTWKFWG